MPMNCYVIYLNFFHNEIISFCLENGTILQTSGVVAVVELLPRPQDSMSGWAGPEVQSAQSNWKQNKGLMSVYNLQSICTFCILLNLNLNIS
jgi:hypothetical protein